MSEDYMVYDEVSGDFLKYASVVGMTWTAVKDKAHHYPDLESAERARGYARRSPRREPRVVHDG